MAGLGAGVGSKTRPSVSGINRYALRFCLLGEAGTGKSCLFHRIKHKEFRDEMKDSSDRTFPTATSRTRFYESYTYTIRPDRRTKISLTVLDTASRERFQSLTAQYYKRNNVILLVCSLDNEYFLTRLSKWYTEAQYYVEDPNVIYAVVAMKSDLPPVRREVTRQALLDFARHYSISEDHVFEVSALTGEGVDEMLLSLCEAVIEQFQRGSIAHYGLEQMNSTERSLLLANPGTNNTLVTVRLDQPTHTESEVAIKQGRCHNCSHCCYRCHSCRNCSCTGCTAETCTIL